MARESIVGIPSVITLEEVRCHSNPMIRSPITVNAIKILNFTYRLYSPLADGWNKEYAGSGCACKQYVLTVVDLNSNKRLKCQVNQSEPCYHVCAYMGVQTSILRLITICASASQGETPQ